MKLKFLSMIAVITTIGITATPITAQVQPSTIAKQNSLVAQNLPMEEDLNLTVEQKEQLKQIRENTASQINIILNSEQQKQFQSFGGDRSNSRANMQQLNLDDTQRSQIQEIMQSSRQEMSQVLTDEQNQMLQELREKSFDDSTKSLKASLKKHRRVRKLSRNDRHDKFEDVSDDRRDRFEDVSDDRHDKFEDVSDDRHDKFEDVSDDRRDRVEDFRD